MLTILHSELQIKTTPDRPERDVDALADKLAHLIDHPETWESMGRAGRALVEEQFDIDKLNDRLVEIYQRLIDGEFDRP